MTLSRVFDVDGTRGLAAIYTVDSSTPTDDAPLTNPKANLASIQWHSKFRYLRVVADQTVSVSLPAISANVLDVRSFNLFAHGRSGIPLVMGSILIQRPSGGAIWCPLTATTPTWAINTANGSISNDVTISQIVSLGSNSTHARLQVCTQGTNGSPVPAKTISVRVIVLDQML